MPDTLAANVAEITQELVGAVTMQMPQTAPLTNRNIVDRRIIPDGRNALELPRANSTFAVQTPTEGDDIVASSQFDLTSTTISPTLRVQKVRVSQRAQYFSMEDLLELISQEAARSQGQDIDTDLSAEFTNFLPGHDVGTTNTDLTLAVLRESRRRLDDNTVANGGPAPFPRAVVLSPIAVENLLTNLGLQGAVASTSPWVPKGMSEDFIRQYAVQGVPLVGIPIYWDGYLTEDGSGDSICAMLAQQALQLAIKKDWGFKQFEESEFVGVILRWVADYNSGVGKYSGWGSQITADGA